TSCESQPGQLIAFPASDDFVPADEQCYTAQPAGICWCTSSCSPIPTPGTSISTPPYIAQELFQNLPPNLPPCSIAFRARQLAKNQYSRKKRSSLLIDLPGVGSCEFANLNFKGAASCIKWYKRNSLKMHLFYGSMYVDAYTEVATYPLLNLISDIGGHAGVWLGFSVLTFFEVVGMFVLSIKWIIYYFLVWEKPRRQVQPEPPREEHIERDSLSDLSLSD
ncbi:hypothetical protein PENTCL1PPCAC_9008, partial [Pristionchus entomophagus]